MGSISGFQISQTLTISLQPLSHNYPIALCLLSHCCLTALLSNCSPVTLPGLSNITDTFKLNINYVLVSISYVFKNQLVVSYRGVSYKKELRVSTYVLH